GAADDADDEAGYGGAAGTEAHPEVEADAEAEEEVDVDAEAVAEADAEVDVEAVAEAEMEGDAEADAEAARASAEPVVAIPRPTGHPAETGEPEPRQQQLFGGLDEDLVQDAIDVVTGA